MRLSTHILTCSFFLLLLIVSLPSSAQTISRSGKTEDVRAAQEAKAKAEREKQQRESKAKAEREKQEREARAKAEREQQQRDSQVKAEREKQEREARAKAEREQQQREAQVKAEREKKEREARAKAEREQQQRDSQVKAEREKQEREARAKAEREQQQRDSQVKAEREKQEREARAKAEREQQQRDSQVKAEREKQEREARAKAEREKQEREARAKAEREQQQRDSQVKAEREKQEREARAKVEREQQQRDSQVVAEREKQQREARAKAEREQQQRDSQVVAEREKQEREARAKAEREQQQREAQVKAEPVARPRPASVTQVPPKTRATTSQERPRSATQNGTISTTPSGNDPRPVPQTRPASRPKPATLSQNGSSIPPALGGTEPAPSSGNVSTSSNGHRPPATTQNGAVTRPRPSNINQAGSRPSLTHPAMSESAHSSSGTISGNAGGETAPAIISNTTLDRPIATVVGHNNPPATIPFPPRPSPNATPNVNLSELPPARPVPPVTGSNAGGTTGINAGGTTGINAGANGGSNTVVNPVIVPNYCPPSDPPVVYFEEIYTVYNSLETYYYQDTWNESYTYYSYCNNLTQLYDYLVYFDTYYNYNTTEYWAWYDFYVNYYTYQYATVEEFPAWEFSISAFLQDKRDQIPYLLPEVSWRFRSDSIWVDTTFGPGSGGYRYYQTVLQFDPDNVYLQLEWAFTQKLDRVSHDNALALDQMFQWYGNADFVNLLYWKANKDLNVARSNKQEDRQWGLDHLYNAYYLASGALMMEPARNDFAELMGRIVMVFRSYGINPY